MCRAVRPPLPLSERQRVVFELVETGLPQQVIADFLDVPLTTVASRLRHARRKMGIPVIRYEPRPQRCKPLAENYFVVKGAYDSVSEEVRDYMLVGDLMSLVVEDLVSGVTESRK